MQVTVDAEGRTRVRDRYVITAPVTGRLERIGLRVGDLVASGTVVARLAPLPLDAATEAQARARLAAAEALEREANARVAPVVSANANALRNAERARALEAAGGLAPRELEQAELLLRTSQGDVKAAEFRLRAAAAEVRAARAALFATKRPAAASEFVVVRSPVAGRVLRTPDLSERVVVAGTPVIELGDVESLEVVVDVLSSDAVQIRPGATVLLEEWGGNGSLRGCVRRVEPSATTRVSALGVEEQRVDVLVDILDRSASLGDGYQVQARIVLWQGDSVLTLPSSAVFQSEGQWQVYVVRDGRARLQRVSIGQRSASVVQVLGGVPEGTPVIIFPSDEVADGIRVIAR